MTDQTPQGEQQAPQTVTVVHPAFPDRIKRQVPAEKAEGWLGQGWLRADADPDAPATDEQQPQPTTVEAPAAAAGTATATGTPGVPDASGPTAPPSAPTP